MDIKRIIFLALLLISLTNASYAGKKSAVITKYWIEMHSGPGGDYGITAHVDFSVKNFKNSRVYVHLNLYDENGNQWFGNEESYYCLGEGHSVGMVVYFEPTKNEQSYSDIKLHIPGIGMQLKYGTHYYHAVVEIALLGDVYARSKPCAFSAFGCVGSQGYPGWASYEGPLNDNAPTPEVKNTTHYAQSNTSTYTYNSDSSSRGSTASTAVAAAVIGIIGYGLIQALIDSSSSSSEPSSYSSSSSQSSGYSSSSYKTCPSCNGRGMEICSNCHGTGIANTGFWGTDKEPCRFCNASGQFQCRKCYGKGRVR